MADRIDVNTDKLETMVRQLRTLQDKLEDVAGDLQSMNMSQRNGGEYRSRASISLKNGSRISGSTARDVVRSAGRSANSLANYAGKLANSVQRVADMFENNENQIVEVADTDVSLEELAAGIAGAINPAINRVIETLDKAADPFEQQINNIRDKLDRINSGIQGNIEWRRDYEQDIEYRINNAVDKEVAQVYKKYRAEIEYGSQNYVPSSKDESKAYYDQDSNEIFLNWKDDSINSMGAGTTHFHEVGHMIDDYTSTFGNSSSSKSFSEAIKNDYENYVASIMKNHGCSREEAYDEISDQLWYVAPGQEISDVFLRNGISDLLDGLSLKQTHGITGHETEYWTDHGTEHGIPDKVNEEAFAHFFEACMSDDPTKLEYMKKVFPTAYIEFKKIIKSEL